VGYRDAGPRGPIRGRAGDRSVSLPGRSRRTGARAGDLAGGGCGGGPGCRGQHLFALYVRSFGHYNAIYGSLGAVIAFMFFVYLSAEFLLLGAEMASEWPRVRDRLERGDTEQGPPFGQQLKAGLRGLWQRAGETPKASLTLLARKTAGDT
jgi:Virulence factor BrkB